MLALLPILLAAYGTVLVAELVGDKTLYTLCALVSRYRLVPLLVGATAAFMIKVAVAVAVGDFVSSLPGWVTASVSAATFFAMAFFMWRSGRRTEPQTPPRARASTHGALVAFASVFFTEWGDIGQVTAALLAAHYPRPAVIWAGATLALVTKAILAMTLGMGLSRWLPRRPLRITAVLLLGLMGTLALLRVD